VANYVAARAIGPKATTPLKKDGGELMSVVSIRPYGIDRRAELVKE